MATVKGGNTTGPSNVAIDSVSSEDVQRVKMTWGDATTATRVDTATPLPVGDAGGTLTVDAPVGTPVFVRLSDGSSAIATLPVSLASLPALAAGTNAIGAVTSRLTQTRISQTPTVSTSPAYTSGDAVGGKLTFASAARTSGGSITIPSVTIIDKAKQSPVLELWLFTDDFTAATDNAAWDPSAADLANLFCDPIVISGWKTGTNRAAAGRIALGAAGTLVGTSLYGQLVTRSTPTFAGTSDIIVIVQTVQD